MSESQHPRPSPLPVNFRKWDIDSRRRAVARMVAAADYPEVDALAAMGADPDMIDLADVMIESAVGYLGLPLGICRGVVVDGTAYDVPMATEEPSVVAAANYAAGIVGRAGGFTTWAEEPVTTGQLFIEGASANARDAVADAEVQIREMLNPVIRRMAERGGGFRGVDVMTLPATGLLRVQIHLDVRDAMGANIVNTAAERIRPLLEELSGGRCLMAILSNAAERRRAGAQCTIPVGRLSRGGIEGAEIARRVELASELAQEDHTRAVTHNKGVMNGITAVTITTGNDNRAVEAAIHRYAGRDGTYRGVATYRVEGDLLYGAIEVPIALGTIGGAAGIHPASRLGLSLLGSPSATELARIAVSVGLAQNLAAVMALVTEGIQSGHMALHARRLAWMAGARGEERIAVTEALIAGGIFNLEEARRALAQIRSEHDS